MSEVGLGRFDSSKAAIAAFAFERVEAVFLRPDAPPVLNIASSLAAFLRDNGVSSLAAEEAAERQFRFALKRVEDLIARWHG
jgi:hypothetical protein